MKYHKFEKIVKGDNPIIKITYKTWWGKEVVRDAIKCESVEGFWVFMDSDSLTHQFNPINTFYNSPHDTYLVNHSS